jgi:DNA-binding HxlR family transcriptional regulator
MASSSDIEAVEEAHERGVEERQYDDRERIVALLDAVGDEVSMTILTELVEGTRTIDDLVEACDASRSTVYRRLTRLESLDLVRETVQIHTRSNQSRYETSLQSATLQFGEEPELTLRFGSGGGSGDPDDPDAVAVELREAGDAAVRVNLRIPHDRLPELVGDD